MFVLFSLGVNNGEGGDGRGREDAERRVRPALLFLFFSGCFLPRETELSSSKPSLGVALSVCLSVKAA